MTSAPDSHSLARSALFVYRGVLVALIAGGIIGLWTMGTTIASMQEVQRLTGQRIDRLNNRLTYLERRPRNYIPPQP